MFLRLEGPFKLTEIRQAAKAVKLREVQLLLIEVRPASCFARANIFQMLDFAIFAGRIPTYCWSIAKHVFSEIGKDSDDTRMVCQSGAIKDFVCMVVKIRSRLKSLLWKSICFMKTMLLLTLLLQML